MHRILIAVLPLTAGVASASQWIPDPPKTCGPCASWNVPLAPFRIFGNTYYVGTTELSAILIAGKGGLVLLDGALPQSAPLIKSGIEALGFRPADVRLIVNSHTHYDHAGGIAALQRLSGATVAASRRSAEALRAGKPTVDDPQSSIEDNGFPPVQHVEVVADGESLTVGDVRITAHFTPGHTPGGTTWTWQSCEGERCLNVVYADSLTPVSADGFRFSGGAGAPSIVDAFEGSLRDIETLPCDILLTPHPGFFDMQDKLRRRNAGEPDAFVDASACRSYASAARARLTERINKERASPIPPALLKP